MKVIYKLLLLVLLPSLGFSHSLLLNIFDNEDGTITISGGFNTGESAAGALIKLEALDSKEVLFQKRLPDEGELTVKIPKTAYQVILDGGPGHTVTKEGIAPKGGFDKKQADSTQKKQKPQKTRGDTNISSSKAVIISIIVAFILLFATIIVSIINTNKLLAQLKKTNIN